MKISIIVITINVWKDDDLNRATVEYLFIPMRRFLYSEYFNPTIIEWSNQRSSYFLYY